MAIEACREYLGVIEDENISVVEIINNIFEQLMFYGAYFAIDNHKARFIAVFTGILSQEFFRKIEVKAR